MKRVVYVCYEEACDAYNQYYDVVIKVVAKESQAISWVKEDGEILESIRSYEEFEVEE